MKHLNEYRDFELSERYLSKLHDITTRNWTIMEVCGGQTHSLVKNGIMKALPSGISLIHGPGCPVCVTPINLIDQAIHLAEQKDIILCSFGDMLRVPGTKKSLLESKSTGSDIRLMYSPLDAVKLAANTPTKEVVFFAVGFETTAPANALAVIQAHALQLKNFSILTSHVLVPAAMAAILNASECKIQGFLAAGHVCAIMGLSEYSQLTQKYHVPIVATGFEPVDLLQGLLMTIQQLENGESKLENQYARIVSENGNIRARNMLTEVFEIGAREWRGMGVIPTSGYHLRSKYCSFDALKRFGHFDQIDIEPTECIAGEILKGNKKPQACGAYGIRCRPETPLGAPMVSSEGACAAYFDNEFANSNLIAN